MFSGLPAFVSVRERVGNWARQPPHGALPIRDAERRCAALTVFLPRVIDRRSVLLSDGSARAGQFGSGLGHCGADLFWRRSPEMVACCYRAFECQAFKDIVVDGITEASKSC